MKSGQPNKINLLDHTPTELRTLVTSWGFKPFAGTQLALWLYHHRQVDFDRMTNLSQSLRDYLHAFCVTELPQERTRVVSSDGTVKYLLSLSDDATVETVLIPTAPATPTQKTRQTACISSQVGCNMGCRFCHTGTQKKVRNLTHAEIIGQILFLYAQGHVVTNGVFMGMGEPLEKDQIDVTLRVCATLTEGNGIGIGHRKVTVSTCGLLPGLKRMMAESKVNLAVSLHAPNQEVRAALMPISKKYDMDALIEMCRTDFPDQRKRITFEYVLLKDVNDAPSDAAALVAKLHGVRAKINLLNFNPFPGSPYARSSDDVARQFSDICYQKGIQTNIRTSRGRDVMAACGQLRSEVS